MAAAQLLEIRLCSICRELDMRKFVYISQKRRLHPLDPYENIPDDLDLNSDQVYRHHKGLRRLRASASECELCAEIWRIFSQNTGVPLDDLTDEVLKDGLSGTQLYLMLFLRKGARLVVFQRDLEHDTGRLVASLQIGVQRGQKELREYQSRIAGREWHPGWAISQYSGSDECFTFAKNAIDECATTHVRCNQAKRNLRAPSRVIDIRDRPRVVTTTVGWKEKYAALSYCWGGDRSPATLTTTTEECFAEGIPETIIPAVIEDAITTCKKLELHFLWVDALCILQDSDIDRPQELSKMRDIYRGAFVTIHGSSAGKTSDRLFIQRDIHHIRFPWSASDDDGACVYLYEDSDNTIMTAIDAPVNKRAWCFQESTLATRSLWIGQRQNLFECAEIALDERGVYVDNDVGHHKRLVSALSRCEKHWIKAWRLRHWGVPALLYFPIPLPMLYWHDTAEQYRVCMGKYRIPLGVVQIFRRSGSYPIILRNPRRIIYTFTTWTKEIHSIYDTWHSVVEQYSRRELTYPKDTFPALSGLADAYYRVTGEEYIAGMWTGDLIRSLTWQANHLLPNDEQQVRRLVDEHRSIGYLAPSWSWASVGLNNFCRFSHRSQLSWQFHPTVSVLNVWANPTDALQPFGEISDAELVLRGPLLSIRNPYLPPDPTSAVPLLQQWLHMKSTRLYEQPSALAKVMPILNDLEYALKHEEHIGQEFALLKICVERNANASHGQGYILTAPGTFLILETCARKGDLDLQYWRRVGMITIPTEIDPMGDQFWELPRFETPGGRAFVDKAQAVVREIQGIFWTDEVVHLV